MPTEQKFVSAGVPLLDGVQIFTNRSEVEQVAARRNTREYNKCLKQGRVCQEILKYRCLFFFCTYLDYCSSSASELVFL